MSDRDQWEDNKLECKVRAINRANEFAKALRVTLSDLFRPLLGKNLEKVDGTLFAKYQKLIDALGLPNTNALHFYRITSNYSLAWTVKVYEYYGDANCYYEAGVYVGNMRNGVLTEMLIDQAEERKRDKARKNGMDFDDATPIGIVDDWLKEHGLIEDESEFRSDYTAEEIRRKRHKYQEAKKVADEAKSALYPFGESDYH